MTLRKRVSLGVVTALGIALAGAPRPAEAAPRLCGHICVEACWEAWNQCAEMGCTVYYCGDAACPDGLIGAGCAPA